MATVTHPALDRLIAESKQITADLVALRREVGAAMSAHAHRDARSCVTNRAWLALEQIRALGDQLHELWREAAGLRERTERRAASSTALTFRQHNSAGGAQ